MNHTEILELILGSFDKSNSLHDDCVKMMKSEKFMFKVIGNNFERDKFLGLFRFRYKNFILPNLNNYLGVEKAMLDLEKTEYETFTIISLVDANGEFKLFMNESLDKLIATYYNSSTNMDEAKKIEDVQIQNPFIRVNPWICIVAS
jgi:hypothetical protein